jgi:hypothetical protein
MRHDLCRLAWAGVPRPALEVRTARLADDPYGASDLIKSLNSPDSATSRIRETPTDRDPTIRRGWNNEERQSRIIR